MLKFGNASDFIGTEAILFRSISPVNTFACRCPTGFQGRFAFRVISWIQYVDRVNNDVKMHTCIWLCKTETTKQILNCEFVDWTPILYSVLLGHCCHVGL